MMGSNRNLARAAIASFLSIAAFAALVPTHAHADPLAYNSHVRAQGTVSGGGGFDSRLDEDTNMRSLSVETAFTDGFGNESLDEAALRLDAGIATALTHACSGGNAAFGGSASAAGFVDFNQVYQLLSPTLPAGTLVPVHFNYASAAVLEAGGTDLDNPNDTGSTGAHVELNLATTDFTSVTLVHVNGSITRSLSYPNAVGESHSGNFDPEHDSGSIDFLLAVGSGIRLSLAADVSANSTAFGIGAINDNDQLAVTWGFDATGDAILSTDDTSPMSAPAGPNGTQQNAVDHIPERELYPPEPASLSVVAFGAFTLLRHHRRAR